MKNIVPNIGSTIKVYEEFVEREKIQKYSSDENELKETTIKNNSTLTQKIFTSHEIRIKSGIQKLFEKDKKTIPVLHDSSSVLMKFTETSYIMNRIERILFSRQLPPNQRNPKSSFPIALLLEFAHNQCDLTV